MPCPHCQSMDLEFDIASDALIHLSFWLCPGCGRRGIVRIIDRKPPAVVCTHPRATPPGHAPRRAARDNCGPRQAA
jgi:hypothetical protein